MKPRCGCRGRSCSRVGVAYSKAGVACRGLRGQRRGPPAGVAPVLAPAARGCPAVLAAPARGETRYAGCARCARTIAASQKWKRAARAGRRCCAPRLRTGAPPAGGPRLCQHRAWCAQPPPCRSQRSAFQPLREALRSLRAALQLLRPVLQLLRAPLQLLRSPLGCSARTPPTLLERQALAGRGDVCGAEQRSLGVGARSALRTSDSRRLV